jgi:hypothetical protein
LDRAIAWSDNQNALLSRLVTEVCSQPRAAMLALYGFRMDFLSARRASAFVVGHGYACDR